LIPRIEDIDDQKSNVLEKNTFEPIKSSCEKRDGVFRNITDKLYSQVKVLDPGLKVLLKYTI